MFYQNFGDWSSIGKSILGPFSDLQNINNRILEQLTRENLDTGSSNLASVVQHVQNLQKSKKPEDFAEMHLDFVSGMSSKGLKYAQNVFKIFDSAINDYSGWCNNKASEILKNTGLVSEKKTKS